MCIYICIQLHLYVSLMYILYTKFISVCTQIAEQSHVARNADRVVTTIKTGIERSVCFHEVQV